VSYVNAEPVFWYPSGQAGASLTPSGVAWTFSSWFTVVPAAAVAMVFTQLAIQTPTLSAETQFEIEIARGVAGAEIVLTRYRSTGQTGTPSEHTITWPIPTSGIGVGDRVAARIRLSTTQADPWLLTIGYYDIVTFTSDHVTIQPLQILPYGATGALVAMGGSPAWTNGAWTEITAGLTQPALLAGLALNGINSTDWVVELGTGAAASEVPLVTSHGTGGTESFTSILFPRPYYVPENTRIAVRLRQSSTATGDIGVALLYYGDAIVEVPPPTGGGTPEPGDDPAAGLDLCTAETPVPWIVVQMDGPVEKSYAGTDVAIDTVPREARVQSFGTIDRALSSADGALPTATQTVVLSDYDRALRAAADAGTLLNKRVDTYVSTRTGIIAAATPRRVFQGIIRGYKALPELKFQLKIEDFFNALMNITQGKKFLPQRTLTTADFPNLPETSIGKAVPILYGLCSDEHLGTSALGVCPLTYVGDEFISPHTWRKFLLCGHAVKQIQSIFIPSGGGLSTGTAEPSRTKITTDGVDTMWPGQPFYTSVIGADPYEDINGNRYTFVRMLGPRSDLAADGRVPLAANVAGIEDVGDGSGDLITSLPYQLLHLLTNWMLQSYESGDWLDIPTVGPFTNPTQAAYARISSSSFDVVQAHLEDRLPTDGYQGAFMLGWEGQFHAWRDVIRDSLQSWGGNLGINKDGQIIASIRNPDATIVKAWRDVLDIIDGSFDSDRDFPALANRINYRYAQRYVTPVATVAPGAGEFLPASIKKDVKDWLGESTVESTASQAKLASSGDDGVQTYALDLPWVREQSTADNVAAQVNVERKDGPITAAFEVGLCGTSVELGQRETVTHLEGPLADGWEDRSTRVERKSLNLDRLVDGHGVKDLDAIVADP
jgi:hypothetical protein